MKDSKYKISISLLNDKAKRIDLIINIKYKFKFYNIATPKACGNFNFVVMQVRSASQVVLQSV